MVIALKPRYKLPAVATFSGDLVGWKGILNGLVNHVQTCPYLTCEIALCVFLDRPRTKTSTVRSPVNRIAQHARRGLRQNTFDGRLRKGSFTNTPVDRSLQ